MRRWFARTAAVLAAIFLVVGCATPPAPIARLVVFGDSNVDSGNLFRLAAVPRPPDWRGRSSNGPVVVEYLAERLGAKLENYAVSGATSGPTNILAGLNARFAHVAQTGLASQLDQFEKAGGRFNAHDLVIIWAGSNDIFRMARQDRDALNRRIASVVANIEKALSKTQELGASRILVGLRPPRVTLGDDDDLNGVDLNTAIAAAVQQAVARSKSNIRTYDAYASIADMMANPSRYGFVEVSAVCTKVPTCANDSLDMGLKVGNTFMQWDGIHKTTHVHRFMADQILKLVSP
jgi:phospholipase/lecithinase/hemolysin